MEAGLLGNRNPSHESLREKSVSLDTVPKKKKEADDYSMKRFSELTALKVSIGRGSIPYVPPTRPT